MNAALMAVEGWSYLFDRSPAAVGDEKRRAVLRSGRGNRRVFVQDLEPVELDHVFAFRSGIGIKLSKRQLLQTLDRGRWVGVDANRVPRLEHLRSQLERRARRRSELERVPLGSKSVDEQSRTGHRLTVVKTSSGTGASVAKKRAIC